MLDKLQIIFSEILKFCQKNQLKVKFVLQSFIILGRAIHLVTQSASLPPFLSPATPQISQLGAVYCRMLEVREEAREITKLRLLIFPGSGELQSPPVLPADR